MSNTSLPCCAALCCVQASKREFKPDRVMVYCSCQLPFNPDQPMVMCSGCEEWYHLGCLGIEGASEDELAGFVCEHVSVTLL